MAPFHGSLRLRGGGRKYFLAGNWKMNPGTLEEAKALASAVRPTPHPLAPPRRLSRNPSDEWRGGVMGCNATGTGTVVRVSGQEDGFIGYDVGGLGRRMQGLDARDNSGTPVRGPLPLSRLRSPPLLKRSLHGGGFQGGVCLIALSTQEYLSQGSTTEYLSLNVASPVQVVKSAEGQSRDQDVCVCCPYPFLAPVAEICKGAFETPPKTRARDLPVPVAMQAQPG